MMSLLNDSRVYDNDSTMSGSISGSEIAVIIMCLSHILNLRCTCHDIYVKREYDAFFTPSPCRIATTPSVIAVGLSLLFQ